MAIPEPVKGQFQGFHVREDVPATVAERDRAVFTPSETSRALVPCENPTTYPADARRGDFAWDVYRDGDEVVLRQLAVYPDEETAREFLAEFVAASMGPRDTGPTTGCESFDGRRVTGQSTSTQVLGPDGLPGVTPVYEADETHLVFERWATGKSDGVAAMTVLVREGGAVLLHRTLDEDFPSGESVDWQVPVTRATTDARLLCAFDAKSPCATDDVPALAGAVLPLPGAA